MRYTVGHGVHVVEPGEVFHSNPDDMYTFTTYTTGEIIKLDQGDSAWYIQDDYVRVTRGPTSVVTDSPVTVIKGYAPRNQMVSMKGGTNLPYINGCSSEQLINPVRPGDPTMQLLYIPANSSEQAHHIHATARVVQVLEGRGVSVIGMGDDAVQLDLVPGMLIILDRMVPHHFVTEKEPLLVAPLHIWSSTPLEQGHPMFYGTIKTE
jgi:hypothetical protein